LIRLPLLLIAGVLTITDVLAIVDIDIVAIEVVVDVNVSIDVYVGVVASTPTTPVSPIAVIRDNRAAGHSYTETHSSASEGIVRRINISWIRNRITGINDGRVVLRHINHIGL